MTNKKVSWRFLGRRAALALVLAAAVGGASLSPALADDWHHDQRHEQHWRGHDRRDHDRRVHHPVHYAPPAPAYVYAPPVVYAPPPPPPVGINIVIPLQFR